MKNNFQKHSGFTMLEFIFAISLMIVVVAFIYSSLVHTSDTAVKIEEHISRQHHTRELFERIVREFKNISNSYSILPPPNTSSGVSAAKILLDKNQRGSHITFNASQAGVFLPGRKNPSGVVQINYRLEKNPDRSDLFILVREEIPRIIPASAAYAKAIRFPINRKIKRFQIKFYNATLKTWHDIWNPTKTTTNLPSLIELTIDFLTDTGNLRSYTTLIATTPKR